MMKFDRRKKIRKANVIGQDQVLSNLIPLLQMGSFFKRPWWWWWWCALNNRGLKKKKKTQGKKTPTFI